ncbi:hypothetical protein [Rubrobacter indicoceani]|uniref:hypothetical protein n=1 Tax=Rubrobacter indicoceani TaxID=2051957 RepID=UPI0013C48F69|nr:hypothetical protein [Rubrobacter indicoceani]
MFGRVRSQAFGSRNPGRKTGVLSGYEKITLHCGLHKTGTSYLQTVLHDNAAVLEEHGIEYPTALRKTPGGNKGNHGIVASKYLQNRDIDTVFRSFTSVGNHRPTLLLSGEGFSNKPTLNGGFLEAFLEAASKARVEFLFYLRRPDHLHESAYAQTMKRRAGNVISSGGYRVDFLERLMPFVEAFGRENITIRPYNRKLWPDGELGADFCAAIGRPELWPHISPDQEKTVNASLNRDQVFLLSRLTDPKAKKRLIGYFAENPGGLPGDGGKFFLSPEERRAINARHAESNQRLADLFDLGDINEFLGIEEDEDDPGWRPYRPDWERLFGYLARFTDHERRK